MKLKSLVEKYIEHRHMMGEKFRTNAVILRAFCRVLGDNRLSSKLPTKKVLKFLYNQEQITTGWFVKRTAMQGFYDYAMSRGYIRHCPLPKNLPKRPPGFIPYIYSKQELQLGVPSPNPRNFRQIFNPLLIWQLVLLSLLRVYYYKTHNAPISEYAATPQEKFFAAFVLLYDCFRAYTSRAIAKATLSCSK